MWAMFGESDFILRPKHAIVFCASLIDLADAIGCYDYEADDAFTVGVGVFDRLTQGQKQVLLLQAAQALLDPDVQPPRVTACLAAAVDAIYHSMLGLAEIEIDIKEEGTKHRQRILDAVEEMGYWNDGDLLQPGEEPLVPPAPDCTDVREWDALVEALRMEVLEDYDFDMEARFADMDPEASKRLKRQMNILPDYFTAIPHDPRTEEIPAIKRQILTLAEPRTP